MLASGLVLPPIGQADKMLQVSGALTPHVISLDANYTSKTTPTMTTTTPAWVRTAASCLMFVHAATSQPKPSQRTYTRHVEGNTKASEKLTGARTETLHRQAACDSHLVCLNELQLPSVRGVPNDHSAFLKNGDLSATRLKETFSLQ